VTRVAVIGLGQRIAHVLIAMRNIDWPVEIAGYVDPAPVGRPILDEAGLRPGPAYADVATMLAETKPDLVMIGSPNHLHLEHLKAALAHGAPIFTEKPIVRTIAESCAVARLLANPARPPVFVGLVMRSMPIVREVIARVDAGDLGEVISIDATEHLHPEHGAYLARNWRRRAEWGGSFLLDKVCHDFDIFGRLAGVRAESVASFGGRRIFVPGEHPRHYDDGEPAYALRDAGWNAAPDAFTSDMDLADHQHALVRYGSGLTLSFHCNSHASLLERRWYIAGTRGTLLADLVRNRLLFRPSLSRKKPERMEFGALTADLHNGADEAMAEDLRRTLAGEMAFPVTPGESIEAGLTVMAIDQAMAENRVVDMAPIWAELDAQRAPV
jgi:predicted dehydrogenase